MHIHDFQLLTVSITFAYDVVFVPFTGPSNWRVCFSKRLCPWSSRIRRCTHTDSSATVLIPMFSPESSFHQRCFFCFFPPPVPICLCSLAECQVQGKLKPRLSSPYDLFKRWIRNGSLWADVCHCVKSSRTLPQTSLPVSNHWVASRERLKRLLCW